MLDKNDLRFTQYYIHPTGGAAKTNNSNYAWALSVAGFIICDQQTYEAEVARIQQLKVEINQGDTDARQSNP